MYRDRDFDLQTEPAAARSGADARPGTEHAVGAMAAGDKFLLEVARKAVLTSLDEPEAILYRQHVLADCLDRPAIVREMYAIAVEALQREKGVWGVLHPRVPRRRAVSVRRVAPAVHGLAQEAEAHCRRASARNFSPKASRNSSAMFAKELDDQYLRIVEDHLRRLAFRDGVLMSAELDKGNKGTRYILHPQSTNQSWAGAACKLGKRAALHGPLRLRLRD